MLKIAADDESLLEEMSENLTECCQSEPCSNCVAVKDAVKNNDVAAFMRLTNYDDEKEASEEMIVCKQCMWYYIDEVEVI